MRFRSQISEHSWTVVGFFLAIAILWTCRLRTDTLPWGAAFGIGLIVFNGRSKFTPFLAMLGGALLVRACHFIPGFPPNNLENCILGFVGAVLATKTFDQSTGATPELVVSRVKDDDDVDPTHRETGNPYQAPLNP